MLPRIPKEARKAKGRAVNQFNGVQLNLEVENPPRRQKRKSQPPQEEIDQFWDGFTTKHPGKVFTLLPDKFHAEKRSAAVPTGEVSGQAAATSWSAASALCRAKVAQIVQECRRVNKKYRDFHFDIEFDLMLERYDCLNSLDSILDPNHKLPRAVKRVSDIFNKPEFYIDGTSADDVLQGYEGNCWFLAAVCALCNREHFIKERICIARDEEVGVYGFVFYNAGEWISVVVDDNLYLTKPDYNKMDLQERNSWGELANRQDPEGSWRETHQFGSQALHFAQCRHPRETWLPLLEKAYAKAHGDYQAISGGFVGEGIEDLTGGVTTEIFTSDILNKEDFWNKELYKVNKSFLFGCGTGQFATSLEENGIQHRHAYSIMDAREIEVEPPKERTVEGAQQHGDGKTAESKDLAGKTKPGKTSEETNILAEPPKMIRLLKLRNPWGKTEWTGPWSDGSKEWTPYYMDKLGHRFDNDGVFWMSYDDLLRRFQYVDRTRLFGEDWTKTQQWTSLNVPWSVNYLETGFQVTISEKAHTVFVLSQLDTRYFRGLEGQYTFQLQFRLHKIGMEDYILRSHTNLYMHRSVSAEHEGLAPGTYRVLVKITATRDPEKKSPLDVVRDCCQKKRGKLLSVGLKYDLAHARGGFKQLQREEQDALKRKAENLRKANLDQQRKSEKLKKLMAARQRWRQQKRFVTIAREKSRMRNHAGTLLSTPNRPSVYAALAGNSQAQSSDGDSNTANARGSDIDIQYDTPQTEAVGEPFNSLWPPRPTMNTLSDTEASWDSDSEHQGPRPRNKDNPGLEHANELDEDDEDADQFESGPWNAICVVGLRIYTHTAYKAGRDVKIQVLKRKQSDPGKTSEKDSEKDKEQKLDWDDPSHDATNEIFHMQSSLM